MVLPIVGIVVGAAVAKGLSDINKACNMDDEALEHYYKAFRREAEAKVELAKKKEKLNKRLTNVIKKKAAILEFTVPRFVDVYEVIQKIKITSNAENLLAISNGELQKIGNITSMSLSIAGDVSAKTALGEALLYGLGGAIKKDSERNLSAARSQSRMSRVVEEQAKSAEVVMDTIIQHADRVSTLMAQLNQLFLQSIEETERTIKNNGTDINNYSEYDKSVLMTCVNMASAVADFIKIPVIDENAQITAEAINMLQTGENYINKINALNTSLYT